MTHVATVTQGDTLTIPRGKRVTPGLNAEGSDPGSIGCFAESGVRARRFRPLHTESGIPRSFLRFSTLFPQVVDRGLLLAAQSGLKG